MHHHRVDAHCSQQHDIFGKIAGKFGVAHGMAAIFDHEGAPGIALQIGQRLDESFGLGQQQSSLGGIVGVGHGFGL